MTCDFCGKEIEKAESSYESKQSDLQGTYHWSCFTKLVKEVNRQGQQTLENNLKSAGIYQQSENSAPETV